jgi:hypothetical protein
VRNFASKSNSNTHASVLLAAQFPQTDPWNDSIKYDRTPASSSDGNVATNLIPDVVLRHTRKSRLDFSAGAALQRALSQHIGIWEVPEQLVSVTAQETPQMFPNEKIVSDKLQRTAKGSF